MSDISAKVAELLELDAKHAAALVATASAVYMDAGRNFPSRPIHSDCRVEVLEFDTGIGG